MLALEKCSQSYFVRNLRTVLELCAAERRVREFIEHSGGVAIPTRAKLLPHLLHISAVQFCETFFRFAFFSIRTLRVEQSVWFLFFCARCKPVKL